MATGQDTLFARFLAPLFDHLLDREALQAYRQRFDWEQQCDRIANPKLTYPDYYRKAAFHGIEQGYLSADAAVTYDPITQYVLPPNETWVRQALIDKIQGQPRRILDLGCGTGTTTRLLKQAFPTAEVIGLDLSPHMLVVADDKARQANLTISWVHGNAEHTPFPTASFDLVTASLLFHETPTAVAQTILREAFRLLRPSGEVAILDGNPETLRTLPWLMDIFEEPYIQEFAQSTVAAWLGSAGFDHITSDTVWLINQVTHGLKPTPYSQDIPATDTLVAAT